MAASLWDLSLASFRDQTASALPTPGGGSVCAVSASLGLGLVLMALEITRGRGTAASAEFDPLIADAQATLRELGSAADEDVRVFEAYMTAHRLPRQTQAEKQTRTEALRRASHEASQVPVAAARAVLRALAFAEQAASLARANVLSDVVAGAELLHASLLGLLATLRTNLAADDQSLEQRDLRGQHDELARLAPQASEAVRARLKSRHSL